MTTFRWYALGLLVLFGSYVALEYYAPKPIDWTLTLSNKDKIPFGTYALFDVLPTLLGTDDVASVRLPIYNQLYNEDAPDQTSQEFSEEADSAATTTPATADTAQAPGRAAPAAPAASGAAEDDEPAFPRATYVFVSEQFASTALETEALRRFVAAGNDLFIAASYFDEDADTHQQHALLTSLGLRQRRVPLRLSSQAGAPAADSLPVSFRAPALRGATLRLPALGLRTYFEGDSSQRFDVLATDERGRAVVARSTVGRGHVLVCCTPLAFSNYYLLQPRTRRFALAALSYLPTGRPVWWDEYLKQGRVGEQSVLRLVLGSPALRAAFYLLLAGTVLFVLVEARRRQRVIPTLRPLPNTTLQFTRTVAGLYRQGRGGHQQIAEKKVSLFLDYLRTRFQEPSPDLGDEAFRERLSQKAGLPRPRIDELVRYINFARTAPTMTDRELLILSRAMHDFKRESQ